MPVSQATVTRDPNLIKRWHFHGIYTSVVEDTVGP
jgi:hypothetical protein